MSFRQTWAGIITAVALATACGAEDSHGLNSEDMVAGDGGVPSGSDDPRTTVDIAARFENVSPCEPDESAPAPARESYGEWLPVELEDTFCSDGSPYKFFVNFAESSNDVVVMLEPGGACWDYASCTGQSARGAANPNGIPDDHMDTWGVGYPAWSNLDLGEGKDGSSLTFLKTWNRVFLPYCTGDVFSGNTVRTYTSEDGSESIEYRHVGQQNMDKIIPWLDDAFKEVPRLLVSGCSAGGIGAVLNYHQLRSGIRGTQCGYLMNDSGPLFNGAGNAGPVQDMITTAWGAKPTLEKFESLAKGALGDRGYETLLNDLGALNDILALSYPEDRLSITAYRWDFNYSLYSYDTFYNMPPNEEIYQMWGEDLEALITQYDRYPNLNYYVPFARPDNCSHCLTIAPLDHIGEALAGKPYLGTEIQESNVDLHDFYRHLLDDSTPLISYREVSPPSGEGLSDAEADACR